MRKIEEYNGVIIADVVGLGKSIIASLVRTIRQIARCDRIKDQGMAVNELADVLEQLRELRGDGYLDPIRRQAASEAILVTIEKH